MRDDDSIKKFRYFPQEGDCIEEFTYFLAKVLNSGDIVADVVWAESLYQNPELHVQETILNACRIGCFEDVRQMLGSAPYQGSSVGPSTTSLGEIIPSISTPITLKYLGKAVDGLYMQLVENDKLYKSGNTGNGKFFSIVQSSGTGKSRAMIELRTKGVIVLYMNIRSKDDINGYPERDHPVADILQEFPQSQQEYSDRCYALFTVIFHVLKYTFKYYLPKISKDDELVNHWNENMCDLGSPARAQFFQTVEAQFNKLWKKLGYTNPEAGQGRTNPPDIYTSIATLKGAAKAWNEFATGRFGWKPGSNHPRLVIEFDEAHTLIHLHGNKYRPSTVLCRAIREFSVFDVWVLFASTTPQVADFFAPAISHDSLRVPAEGELLFPPYVHFGWDQNAMNTTKVRPHEVSEFEYIARLGRPLWVSLKGRVSSENAVLNIACEKLCKNRSYNPTDRNQALAVLGARLCLAIRRGHLESNEFNTKAVASHMRILKSITPNRLWQTTIYPSEPLLACAAAIQLHSTSESLKETLEVLSDNILDGMVETGNRGELVSRGLLLIGKDLFVRSLGLARTPAKYAENGKLPDCMSVSVVEYLRST
ncbi:hypothetical protein CTheo_4316 [Ceratobasidium theobromae]|uniref:Uncharacterized protein n=1 Tax=Ceratobasidium theobromae TaxID=1582974 RepID=A0A5N5QKP7_9AGAM|nr:hypothetical protein CTheo_4316 [Ceratobasidium theobromae]